MQPKQEFKALCEYIAALPVFSDHEHHLSDEFFTHPVTLDVLINNSCVRWTGFGCDGSAEARRALLANVRYNSYFLWFEKGVQQLHGITEPICLDNWDAVSAKIAQRYATDLQFHWRSLKEASYERMILDTYWDPGGDGGHPELFVPTFRIDKFMYGFHGESVAPDDFAVWARYGFEGGSVDEFVENMRGIIRERFEQGKVAAFKCAEAYNRHINFQPDDKDAAEAAFGLSPKTISHEQFIAFGNYIFNRCCELAAQLDVPFQVHTGLGQLAGSAPMNLEATIARHAKTRFVLFHAGFPWTHQVAGLAHNYRNVLPSLTWTATTCTSAAVRALHDFIDVGTSINEITWGSDCWVAEESVGAMLAWRFVVGKVLNERIADGLISPRQAEDLARKLMCENGRYVYRC